MTDITAIVTAHREGLLAGPSLHSFWAAISQARGIGLSVQPVALLDRADALTRAMFAEAGRAGLEVVECDEGDPALARAAGVARATGAHVALLDADDLWSENWLVAAHGFVAGSQRPVIAHSQMNIVFGEYRAVWWHADSEADGFDIDFQRVGNYWDALCLARREIFETHPYRRNDIKAGYGHEDWHWNNMTLAAGIAHRPVPGTVHFKRRRGNSQMAMCEQGDVVVFPNVLTRYEADIRGAG